MQQTYLNFQEDGKIIKISNVIDESSPYIIVDKSWAYDFADCKKSMDDYIIVPSDTAESMFEIKYKHTSILENFNVDDSIHQITKKHTTTKLLFAIIQDTKLGIWKIKISDDLKYLLNSTTFYKDKKHHLFVTQENDPNFLLDTLVVNFGELLSGQTYFIENANKEVAQTPNVSVYCGKAFENYKHIVESY
jgi:hypothetical protein